MLVKKLEDEITHAKHWIVQDAVDGVFEDQKIEGFNDLWSEKVDPVLYKYGCGHLARSYDRKLGRTQNEIDALIQHSVAAKQDGLIGKGLPKDFGGGPNEEARNGFDHVIEQTLDNWIREGAFVAELAGKPTF